MSQESQELVQIPSIDVNVFQYIVVNHLVIMQCNVLLLVLDIEYMRISG